MTKSWDFFLPVDGEEDESGFSLAYDRPLKGPWESGFSLAYDRWRRDRWIEI